MTKRNARVFQAVAALAVTTVASVTAYTISNGTMTVLDSSSFGDIDLDGEIVYAVNCGKDWYTGIPTGTNPPVDGNWGDADAPDRAHQIRDAHFEGDIWNWGNDARNKNGEMNFGGHNTGWPYVPTRFQGWETGATYRTECTGYNTGYGHPTNAAPYEGTHGFAADIFPDGNGENRMEQILTVSAQQNAGGYNAGAVDPLTGWVGCGERDMTWHFNVEMGAEYKIQLFFYRKSTAGATGQRIEVEDTLCVDMLDVDLETNDREALLYTCVLPAPDETLTIKVGRQTDGGGHHLAHCCAITLELIRPAGSVIRVW